MRVLKATSVVAGHLAGIGTCRHLLYINRISYPVAAVVLYVSGKHHTTGDVKQTQVPVPSRQIIQDYIT